MLIPIRHENMSARRWPVVTLALIAINIIVFLATHDTLTRQAPELGKVKVHILILAATHPELTLAPEAQQLVNGFKDHNPNAWAKVQDPNHKIIDAWDAHIRLVDEPYQLQQEMDSLSDQYAKLSTDFAGRAVCVRSRASQGDLLSHGEFPARRMAAPDRQHVVPVAGGLRAGGRLGPLECIRFSISSPGPPPCSSTPGPTPAASCPRWEPPAPWPRSWGPSW